MAEPLRRGTLITYQGHRCQSVRFRRSRGFEADQSIVVLPVAAFPDAFSYVDPTPGELAGEIPREGPQSAEEAAEWLGKPPERLPSTLRFAGTLVIADLSDEVPEHRAPVVVHPLFVQRIERLRTSPRGLVSMVQVTLVDERYFWGGRGYLHRWSFNRRRGDGTLALDSVQANGEPFSLTSIAGQVVSCLFRAPQLAAAPAAWSSLTGERSFTRLAPAVLALGELVRQGKVEAPCLRLDGTVALHKHGEGMVGYAPDGKGPNAQPFPPQVRVSRRGTAQGYSLEPTHPDDYLIVAGRERIASVELDEWQPVLILPARVRRAFVERSQPGEEALDFDGERVYALTDELVKKLTRGIFGLDGLRRWILQPPAWQNATGLEASVAAILREQAWRYWRCPEVEVETDPDAAPTQVTRERERVEGGESTPTGAAPARDGVGRPTKPGPNAHLLPLLARAETSGDGHRWPVTVETYRFHTTHRAMRDSREFEGLSRSRKILAQMKNEIRAAAARAGEPDPFDGRTVRSGFRGPGTPTATGLPINWEQSGLSHEAVQSKLTQIKQIEKIREVVGSLGDDYEKRLVEQWKAEDALNGTSQVEAYEVAKISREFERAVQELGLDSRSNDPRVVDLRNNAQRQVEEILRRVAQKREQQEQLKKSGLNPRDFQDRQYAQFVRNLDREIDPRATVYSDRLGIVRTSTLAGWVEEEGVRSQEFTRFVPKPVRVTFGATMRPRTDRPMQSATAERGTVARVPSALSDEVTWFTRAFRRTPGGYEPVPPDAVPTGEGTVIPLERHELIPLIGAGNVGELEQIADELAQERLRVSPRVEGETVVLARAWPVQCDGLVASVEISARERPRKGTGIETKVVVGSGHAPGPSPLRSKVRPPRLRQDGDAARREGLT